MSIKQSRHRRDWGGGHACGVGRIHFAWRGITPKA